MDLFAAMQLKKSEVKKLYKIFSKVDLDGSGSVDIAELLTLLDIERTRFTEQVFTVFDSDGSGKVDFKEFVMATWNYCTIGQASLGTVKASPTQMHALVNADISFCTSDIFAFDMYDRDKSGKLSLEEVHQMLKDLYGKSHINDPKVRA
jgi:serine/threonine-protein phosphatase 2B regulatory subunit